MRRKDRLVIRLYPAEREVIDSLARQEHLPTSTLARKLLLQEAAASGLTSRLGVNRSVENNGSGRGQGSDDRHRA